MHYPVTERLIAAILLNSVVVQLIYNVYNANTCTCCTRDLSELLTESVDVNEHEKGVH